MPKFIAQHTPALFQKRHYEWLADFAGLERRTLGINPEQHMAATLRLARRLREDNPRFNEDRFVDRVIAVAEGRRKVSA